MPLNPAETETQDSGPDWLTSGRESATPRWCVVVLWSEDPRRVGHVAFLGGPTVVGRGGERDDDPHPRASWSEHRPGSLTSTGPLTSRRLSRQQLVLTPAGGQVRVENRGRATMRYDGRPASEVYAREGGVITIEDALVCLVARRPLALDGPSPRSPFGQPDAGGLVGESPRAWSLRERIGFVGAQSEPVLITGPSGTGKEVAARGVHLASPHGDRGWVSRSAATLPEGLVDAELFGNTRNYPNPGMPERPGLVGSANGSSLFLDEIGELPESAQAHLLRVLDAGEYTRLGEARARHARFRMIAATNREATALKHDLAARFALRVQVPGLEERLEDLPLLVHHLLGTLGTSAQRFLDDDGLPRVAPTLVEALALHSWTTHVRELHRLLLVAIESSRDIFLDLTPEVAALLDTGGEVDPAELDADQIRAALDAEGGNRTAAYKRLGLRSRDQLYRLLKRYGIE